MSNFLTYDTHAYFSKLIFAIYKVFLISLNVYQIQIWKKILYI